MNYGSSVCLSTLLVRVKWTIPHLFVDGKDGSYRCQAVDIGGAIQRIKTHHVFTLQAGGAVTLAICIIYIIWNQTPTNQLYFKIYAYARYFFNAVFFFFF